MLVLLTLIVRIVVVVATRSWGAAEPFEYDEAARNIVAGKGFVYYFGLFQTDYYAALHPLYPLMLATLYWMFGVHIYVAQVFQILLSGLVTLLVFLLAKSTFGVRVAVVAAALAALHPGLNVYSTVKIHSEVADVAAFLGLVWAVTALQAAPRRTDLARTGLVLGLAGLFRGPYMVAGGVGVAAVVLLHRMPPRRAALTLGSVALISLLVVSPWLARNWATIGRPTMLSTTGFALWIGNHEGATGTVYASNDTIQWDTLDPTTRQQIIDTHDEVRQQDMLQRMGMDYIRGHPVLSVFRWIRTFVDFWWFTPTMGALYPSSWSQIYTLYYVTLVPLAIAGLAIAWRSRGKARVFCVVAGVAALVLDASQSLFYSEGRHRWEAEICMLVFVAVTLAATAKSNRSGLRERLA